MRFHTAEDVTRLKDSQLYEWLVRGSKTCPVPTTLDMGKHYFGNPVILGNFEINYQRILSMVGMYGTGY